MKNLLTFLGATTLTLGAVWSYANAQTPKSFNGAPLKSETEASASETETLSNFLDFSKINVWVGEGSNKAALMLTFGDDKGMDNLVIGVRFDDNATAADILKAATAFARIGVSDDALTYDLNGDGELNTTYEHSIAAYNYFVDHAGELAAATAETAVADNDIVYVSAATEAAYPNYKFYVPTDDKTGIWTLDEYAVHISSKAQTFPIYLNVGSSSCSSMTATYTNDEGETDTTKASVSLSNAAKGNCRATITTKAMGTININVRAKINGSFTDYVPCKVTIDDAVNKVEEITYTGESDNITIDQYGVVQIPTRYFTASPSTADFTTITCSVSDPDMMYVYSNQYYIARKAGECDIIATAGDGSGVTKKLHVTVKERERVVPEDSYQDGVFVLNEDWYGHAPGSINYFDADGKLYPYAYETNNPGYGFGNTSQFATIFGDRLFVTSKQSLIDSSTQNGILGGGRLVIADAKTLKFITEFATIGNDGRAIVGVNENKVYVGMSKNIRVLNIDNENDTYTLGSTITSGEITAMEVAANRVFALDITNHKVIVINAETDEIVTTIGESINNIAESADGNIWIAQLNKLICYNPSTLEIVKEQDVTDTPVINRGAGYPDNLCASPNENVLFWRDNSGNIYRWDLDKDAPVLLTKLSSIYSELNYDAKSDQLIIALAGYTMQGNSVEFINAKTGDVKSYEMPDYFWFPSVAVPTDKYAAEFESDKIEFGTNDINTTKTVNLKESISDKDNYDANIAISLNGDNAISSKGAATITFADGVLTITPLAKGSETVALKAVSNGRVTEKVLTVVVGDISAGVNYVAGSASNISVNGSVFTFTGFAGNTVFVYSTNGQLLKSAHIADNSFSVDFGLAPGIYFVKADNGCVKKTIIK